MRYKQVLLGMQAVLWTCVATTSFTGCGDDDSSFSPVAKSHSSDYTYTSAEDLSKTPCNDNRDGRRAEIGSEKDIYECVFDSQDSVYIWVSKNDTLTAEGEEFHRAESSSSSENEDSSSSAASSSSETSSSSLSSSSVSSSSVSSSSYSSSSSAQSSSSIKRFLKTKGEQFNPNVIYGTMIDPRDGKSYRTVEINGQTWMAENLNFAGNEVGKSSCYGNDDDLCEIYGRLYSREAALNSNTCSPNATCNLGSAVQGVCPDEWHIPSLAETNELIKLLGMTVNSWVSRKGWAIDRSNGDTYGMSFIPAGLDGTNGFEHLDSSAFMWVYQPNAKQRYLVLNIESGAVFVHDYTSYVSTSVRCVKGELVLSSSSYSSSSSSAKISTPITKKGEQFNPDIEYGTMTDSRDGKTYKTVVVKGRTWMAENLNFTGNNEDFTLQKEYSLCYGNDDNNCELYGRLYSREAAMNSTECGYNTNCNLADPLQGACPAGWHIPSKAEATELNDLALSSSYQDLISAKGWGNDTLAIPAGNDTYGLSFLPAGYKIASDFKNIDLNAFMWANIPGNSQRYFVINPTAENKTFVHNGYDANEIYGSIRCVKDE